MKALVLSAALLFSVSTLYAQKITAEQAKSHEGENETVCGTVTSGHFAASSRGKPTFINLDVAYPRQIFTILIWDEDLGHVGKIQPIGSRLCVTGLITDYRGEPEIVVRSAGQLSR